MENDVCHNEKQFLDHQDSFNKEKCFNSYSHSSLLVESKCFQFLLEDTSEIFEEI